MSKFWTYANEFYEEYSRQQTQAQQQRLLQDLVQKYAAFFALDRQIAMDQITRNVERYTPEQLKRYEIEFLVAGSYNQDPEIVHRAMELYGWLKAEEYRDKGYWVGFAGEKE